MSDPELKDTKAALAVHRRAQLRLLHVRIAIAVGAAIAIGVCVYLSINSPLGIVGGLIWLVAGGGTLGLFVLLMVEVPAQKLATADFFDSYAAARGLKRTRRDSLPESVPLLRRGGNRIARNVLTGSIGGRDAMVAHYTFKDGFKANEEGTKYEPNPVTLVLLDVPEAKSLPGPIFCHQRFGPRAIDEAEDLVRSNRRIELESEQLDKTYEIFADPQVDQVWIRRLFAPTFIDWLATEAPKRFAFEMTPYHACSHVVGYLRNSEGLDALLAAARITAERLAGESLDAS